VGGLPAPAAPATSSADRIARLQQLAELKHMGVLTDAELEAEKARILASSGYVRLLWSTAFRIFRLSTMKRQNW